MPERDAAVAAQAADWIVRLGSDDAAERARAQQGFAAWKAQDPRHAQAAVRIEAFIGQVQALRDDSPGAGHAARAALDGLQRARRRRTTRLAGALVLAAVLALPAWKLVDPLPGQTVAAERADLLGTERQWAHQVLEDGSQVTLSGAGAIRWHFDARSRTVELLRGSVLVQVAHDAARPFLVQTPLGSVRALGTRFTVTRDPDGVRVEMLESRVAVRPVGASTEVEVRAGERVTLRARGLDAVEPMDPHGVELGWQRHQLVVEEQALSEVLDQLARHHPGVLRFDRQALAGLRVSGVLPLDDTGRAVALLQKSFPQLRVRSLASRWLWIDLAPSS